MKHCCLSAYLYLKVYTQSLTSPRVSSQITSEGHLVCKNGKELDTFLLKKSAGSLYPLYSLLSY